MKKYYMHLLDGEPAVFLDGRIVFANKVILTREMAADLKQVRREQRESKRDNEVVEFGAQEKYSHIIVRVE